MTKLKFDIKLDDKDYLYSIGDIKELWASNSSKISDEYDSKADSKKNKALKGLLAYSHAASIGFFALNQLYGFIEMYTSNEEALGQINKLKEEIKSIENKYFDVSRQFLTELESNEQI